MLLSSLLFKKRDREKERGAFSSVPAAHHDRLCGHNYTCRTSSGGRTGVARAGRWCGKGWEVVWQGLGGGAAWATVAG